MNELTQLELQAVVGGTTSEDATINEDSGAQTTIVEHEGGRVPPHVVF